MKRITLSTLAVLRLTIATHAQWAVYDVAVHTQQIISTAQEIAKFVQMVNNQVQQIKQLTEQVNTLHHYVDLFGDPASVVPASITALTGDLKKTEFGKTLTELESSADATAAMLDSGGAPLQRI